jgi:hypothetical protein
VFSYVRKSVADEACRVVTVRAALGLNSTGAEHQSSDPVPAPSPSSELSVSYRRIVSESSICPTQRASS